MNNFVNNAVTNILKVFGLNQQIVVDSFKWFHESENRLTNQTQGHVVRGFLKAFLAYLVPVSLFQRSLQWPVFRRAFALGFFVGGVRLIDSVIETIKEERENVGASDQTPLEKFLDKYSIGISGFMSSFIALSIDGDLYKSIIAVLWLSFRAARGYLPSVPFGSLIIMCISSAQVLASLLHFPQYLSPNYRKFLYKFSGKSVERWISMRNIKEACAVVHPGQGCNEHFVHFWIESFGRSVKLYTPIFLLGLLFSQKKSILAFIKHVARSSTFLAFYTSLAWYSQCMAEASNRWTGKEIFGRVTYRRMCLTTFLAGVPTIIESETRQSELAGYVLTYAVDSLFTLLLDRKIIPQWDPIVNLFVMSTAVGVLLHNHNQQPKVIIKYLFKFR